MIDPQLASRIVSMAMRAYPAIIPELSMESWQVFRAASGYDGIRNTYWAEIYDAVEGYLTSDKPVTSFKNAMKRAMVEAFGGATDLGYEEVGGEPPLDDDTLAWLNAQVDQESGFIDDLFAKLKKSDGLDPIDEAFARADGYTKTLDAIYAEAKMRGDKNKILEWELGETEKHCSTCSNLNGQKHKASWYISRNYIPKKPNADMECKGYNCDCRLKDKNGNEVTI